MAHTSLVTYSEYKQFKTVLCKISCSHSGVTEHAILPEYDAL